MELGRENCGDVEGLTGCMGGVGGVVRDDWRGGKWRVGLLMLGGFEGYWFGWWVRNFILLICYRVIGGGLSLYRWMVE